MYNVPVLTLCIDTTIFTADYADTNIFDIFELGEDQSWALIRSRTSKTKNFGMAMHNTNTVYVNGISYGKSTIP